MSLCSQCQSDFEISPEDKAFYAKVGPIIAGKKYSVGEPTLCPLCRDQRRLAIRNERNLYQRKSHTGESVISCYSADKHLKVLSQKEWWSDNWDPMEFGRDFDFNRPFFDQFRELFEQVPRMNMLIWQNENSDYCSYTDFSRNCYLVFGGSNCQDTYYSNLVDTTVDCIDVSSCKHSEQCYDSIDCVNCHKVVGSISCENSHDLWFCYDCRGSEECLFSYNLKRKKYYIFNKPYSKEEYLKLKQQYLFGNAHQYQELKKKFLDEIHNKAIHRATKLVNCEHCTGDNLVNSKNAYECYESTNLRDAKYVQFSMNCTDSYDVIGSSKLGCELCAEAMAIEGKNIFCGFYISGSDVYYSDTIIASQNIFGCIGLRHKEYCILNKQYTKEEYEQLVPKIIDYMKQTGEWGQFFPIAISPFAYNETVAQEYFPLTKEKALQKGYQWKDEEQKKNIPQTYQIPESIQEVTDQILKEALECKDCGKNFRIIPQELKFYRAMGLPVPPCCPFCRYSKRLKLRNPRRLWSRKCSQCGSAVLSSFQPNRTEIIYCEKCYLATI